MKEISLKSTIYGNGKRMKIGRSCKAAQYLVERDHF